MMKRHNYLIFKLLNFYIVAMCMATSVFAVNIEADRMWHTQNYVTCMAWWLAS